MAKDVVCGMDVDPASARAKADYQDKTYYFCSDDCKDRFMEDPEHYAQVEESQTPPNR